MNAQAMRDKLGVEIKALQEHLNGIDIPQLQDPAKIDSLLDKIIDVNTQIQQFKAKCGTNDWNSWGPPLWENLERTWIALERKLNRLNSKKALSQQQWGGG